ANVARRITFFRRNIVRLDRRYRNSVIPPPIVVFLVSHDGHHEGVGCQRVPANGPREMDPKIAGRIFIVAGLAGPPECFEEVFERHGRSRTTVPLPPAGPNDMGEVATVDQIEQQVVALDQNAWPASVVNGLDRRASAFVAMELQACERHSITEVSMGAVVDIAHSGAFASDPQVREMLAQA